MADDRIPGHESEETPSQPGGHVPFRRHVFSSPPGLALRQFVRRNMLIGVSTALFILATILVIEQIDQVYYNRDKKDVISELINRQRLLTGNEQTVVDDLTNLYVQRYLSQSRPIGPDERDRTPEEIAQLENKRQEEERARLELAKKIEQSAVAMLRRHPYLYRFHFSDIDGNTIVNVEDQARRVAQNDWSNSLFVQDYTSQLQKFKPSPQPVAIMSVYLTTPRGVPEIEELTQMWRIRSGIVILGIFVFYGFILWGLLLPVRNVIMALDKGAAVGSPLIEKPRTVLEKYYNNLARDATLSIFSTALRDFFTERKLVDPHPLMEYAPKLINELFPVYDAELWSLRLDASGSWIVETKYSGTFESPGDFEGILLKRLFVHSPLDQAEAWNSPLLEYYDENDKQSWWIPEMISTGEDTVCLLVVSLRAMRHGSTSWWKRLVGSIGRELRFSLRTIAEQRRLILQEKSKANITLSRNIGHDLTNIIATSKLELMNVKTLLEMPREEVYASEVKQKIFKESLEALLNNTRFLQETVNLYRSFTYLSRPKFETISLNDLIADVSALFKLSLSRSIEMHLELDPRLEMVELEPRLMRLALFNLLSNASESIMRASTDRVQGRILIRTERGSEGNGPTISIEDNGGGIRDRDGRMMEPHEIAAIFQLGYSTKEKESGEGLGLNWVQQIVHDFHGGDLSARNLPEGGAAFIIRLAVAPRNTPLPRPDSLIRGTA